MPLDPETQEPEPPALTGDETPADIKTDYSRATSKQVANYINRDHAIIQKFLSGNSQSGGGATGSGRYVGRVITAGRAVKGTDPDAPEELWIPNAIYRITGADVEINELSTYAVVNVPLSKYDGFYAFLKSYTQADGPVVVYTYLGADDGSAEVPEDISDFANNEAAGYPCLGLIKTDAVGITSIDYTYTDEIQVPALLLQGINRLQGLIDALGVPGGGGGAARLDLLPYDAANLDVDSKTKLLQLIAEAEQRAKDYADTGRSKPMQTDNDHFVEGLVRLWAAVVRVSPEAHDLIEGALVSIGFAGHSLSGDFADPGVNDTVNQLRYTTLALDVPNRVMRPGSPEA